MGLEATIPLDGGNVVALESEVLNRLSNQKYGFLKLFCMMMGPKNRYMKNFGVASPDVYVLGSSTKDQNEFGLGIPGQSITMKILIIILYKI